MNYVELTEEQINNICERFKLSIYDQYQLTQLLKAKHQERFLNPKTVGLKQDSFAVKELLEYENFKALRAPFLKKLSEKYKNQIDTSTNFSNLKNRGLLVGSNQEKRGEAWIKLTGLGQAYFKLIFGKLNLNEKSYFDEQTNKILDYLSKVESIVRFSNSENDKEFVDQSLSGIVNQIKEDSNHG